MMWSIHYKTGATGDLRSVSTLPLAISAACELLDQGADVSAIEGDGGLKGMGADEIRLICAKRKAKKLNGTLPSRPSSASRRHVTDFGG